MLAVKGYYNGTAFIPLVPVKAKRNQSVIITILDDYNADTEKKPFEKYVGKLSYESYEEITAALLEAQSIDIDEW